MLPVRVLRQLPSHAAAPVARRWRDAPVRTRVRAAVGLVGAAALGTALACALVLDGSARLHHVLIVAALLVLAEHPLVHLRFGSSSLALVWTEAVVVLGLVWLPAPLLVLLLGPGITLSHLLQRHERVKALYNGLNGTLAAAVAGLVVHGLVPERPDITSAQDIGALVLAALAYTVCNTLLTHGIVTIAQELRLGEVVRAAVLPEQLAALGNCVLALGVLVLLRFSPAVLVALPVLAVLLAAVYRGYLRANQERDAWRQLEVASRELNRLEEREVVSAALRRARELFRCDDVELDVEGTDRNPARTHRLDGDALVSRPLHGAAGGGDTFFVELDTAGRERPVTTAVSAPLDAPHGRVGALRLLFAGEVRLSPRERQVLLTYAHAVSTTLQNARLHEDVRAEAARHAHEASHDPLTGLANRVLLQSETWSALQRGDGTTALLLLDLDHFKEVNDTLGHQAGDALLLQTADRLRAAVGDAGLVARLGGDEFAVLLRGLAGPADAEPLAARVLQHLAVPVEYEGLRLGVEASLGIAAHPQDADSPEELFRRADVAMYQAKATRGSWLRYDAGRDGASVERLALVSELRQALEDDQLVVHFQPQRDLRSGQVVSAEALVRWQHPVRGLLAPGQFIGVVERSGLVQPFTLRVLGLALEACADWNEGGGPRVRVGVNLAARNLLDPHLPDDVAALLLRTGTRPTDLVLEITETTATSELEVVEEVLARLRHSGVEISVDDFGTGYSSLAFLQRSAVNELKVDQSFVRGMLRSDSDAALVRATVQLAHSLGARAVAEGVEDAAHARALRGLGCDVAQGWLYGQPVPADELRALLERERVRRVPSQRVVRLRP